MRERRFGSVLVGLQFGLIAVLAGLAGLTLVSGRVSSVSVWLAAASAAVGLWAVASHRPGNFNIHPEPRAGGRLVQRGPYRWVRHPMYTAVLGFGLACAWTLSGTGLALALGWASLAGLAVVLVLKARLEERWLLSVHPGYAAYQARTRRFLPGLW